MGRHNSKVCERHVSQSEAVSSAAAVHQERAERDGRRGDEVREKAGWKAEEALAVGERRKREQREQREQRERERGGERERERENREEERREEKRREEREKKRESVKERKKERTTTVAAAAETAFAL